MIDMAKPQLFLKKEDLSLSEYESLPQCKLCFYYCTTVEIPVFTGYLPACVSKCLFGLNSDILIS